MLSVDFLVLNCLTDSMALAKNQHSTLNIQHSLNHSTLNTQHSTFKKSFNTQHSTLVPVEHRSKRPLAIEELLRLLLDTQLSDHLEIIIAALHAEPSVLHTDKGNAGNQ